MTTRIAFASIFLSALFSPAQEVREDPAGAMVLVPAGKFIFGDDGGEPDERPRRERELAAFWIDVTEVSVSVYARFVEATGRAPPPDWPGGRPPVGAERLPVVNVTWDDAASFAAWAGKRLPTEAEWERAARGIDGRRFPWGDEDEESRHNVRESGRLLPVDSIPEGRSPSGCLHMFGNAWEWCADWYGPHPGSLLRSIHFGKKYRVFRGGGAISFYGVSVPRSVTARGRGVPFGRYDSLGFRCARDVAAPRPGAGGRAGLPVTLEALEEAGVRRAGEIVTTGVPFARGVFHEAGEVRLTDAGGAEVPFQARVTGTWRDGSVKWLLVDFPVALEALGSARFSLVRREGAARIDPPARVAVEEGADGIRVDTGAVSFCVPRTTGLVDALIFEGARLLRGPIEMRATVGREAPGTELPQGPPSALAIEEHGPLRAVIRAEGPFLGGGRLRWISRTIARAGSPEIEIHATFLNLGKEMAWVRRLRVSANIEGTATSCAFGGDCGPHEVSLSGGTRAVLCQVTDSAYVLRLGEGAESDGRSDRGGTRAPGWIDLRGPRGLAIAVGDCWQNFPKALVADAAGCAVDLWPALPEPFDADPGLAKTHRIHILPHDARVERGAELATRIAKRILASALPSYMCASGAFGTLAPYDFDALPLYESLTEESADLYLRERPHGMRHFGDFYYGGPYKGKNAYGNLEYDMPLNYAMQFARTGLRKYLDAALDQARHQADIDFNHGTGTQYKHGPRHVETEADLGHVFLRGLVEVYHLTGETRLLDAAREIGDWIGPKVAQSRSQGNERQIGWALYALTGIYEATWEPRYLEWARRNVEELITGMGPTGRFDIRWDNRIAFFQGIAASGFLRYHDATGDERVAAATLKMCERMLGYYPDYLGRTLEGLSWAYERSADSRFLELLTRTWETSMLRAINNGLELGAGTIFTVHCLPFIEEAGIDEPLLRPLGLGPAELSSDRGLHRLRLACPSATLLLEVPDPEPFDVLLLRSGCATDAAATVRRRGGDIVATALLGASPSLTQRRAIPLAIAGGGILEVRLETISAPEAWEGPPNAALSAVATSWDIVTSRALRSVVVSKDGAGIETLTPRLFFRAKEGVDRISLVLGARGEGFHGAVLRNPSGNVAAVSANFIDFGDETPREYRLEAGVPPGGGRGLWSLDLQDVSLSMSGAEPWFATSREAFFAPP